MANRTAALVLTLLSAVALVTGTAADAAGIRKEIRVVGSSTVYPFATAVAESLVNKDGRLVSPVIESTGTGAGIKLFCGGVGATYPDIVNASRRIKASEIADCANHGVREIVEVQVGLDGIALGESLNGLFTTLTTRQLYRAIAAAPFGQPNTARTWREIDPALPARPILVYGPPSTSGTRDALAELILEKGCDTDPATKALKNTDAGRHKDICTRLRDDGAYVDAGEQDNLIVQKIAANPEAVGVLGFSFLEENADKLKGVALDGVTPTYDAIADFSYPGARPLYIYVKPAHLKAVAGLRQYVAEWAIAWEPTGYLRRRGMVIAPADVRTANAAVIASMTPLDPALVQ